MKPQLLTTAESAKKLGYTIQHTRMLIRQKKLQAVKVGRDWLIPKEEFTVFLEKHVSSRGRN